MIISFDKWLTKAYLYVIIRGERRNIFMNKKYPLKNPESEVEFAFMAIKDTFSMIFNLIFWIGVAYIIFFSAVNYPLFDELYIKPFEMFLKSLRW